MILDINHWRVEMFRQRMTKKQWREALLAGEDQCFFMGRKRTFVVNDLGCGIVEVSKTPLAERRGCYGA